MSELFQQKIEIVEGIVAGAEEHAKTFRSIELGPVAFERIDRPAIHVLPDRSDYQSGNEYNHVVNVLFYFERTDRSRYTDHLETASEASDSILESLSENPIVGEHKVNSVADFEGEDPGSAGTMLIVFLAEIHVTTLIDFANSV